MYDWDNALIAAQLSAIAYMKEKPIAANDLVITALEKTDALPY